MNVEYPEIAEHKEQYKNNNATIMQLRDMFIELANKIKS